MVTFTTLMKNFLRTFSATQRFWRNFYPAKIFMYTILLQWIDYRLSAVHGLFLGPSAQQQQKNNQYYRGHNIDRKATKKTPGTEKSIEKYKLAPRGTHKPLHHKFAKNINRTHGYGGQHLPPSIPARRCLMGQLHVPTAGIRSCRPCSSRQVSCMQMASNLFCSGSRQPRLFLGTEYSNATCLYMYLPSFHSPASHLWHGIMVTTKKRNLMGQLQGKLFSYYCYLFQTAIHDWGWNHMICMLECRCHWIGTNIEKPLILIG